ncbi:MAG: hypothetical protein ACRC9M_11850, partial [Aeromonas sp.]
PNGLLHPIKAVKWPLTHTIRGHALSDTTQPNTTIFINKSPYTTRFGGLCYSCVGLFGDRGLRLCDGA